MEEKATSRRNNAFVLTHARAIALIVVVYVLGVGGTLSWHGYWSDEFHTINAVHLPWNEMLTQRAEKGHPSFFFTLEQNWMKLLPESEVSYRALPALFGLATTLIVFELVRRERGNAAGLCAAGVLSLSAAQLVIEQVARSYSLLQLLITAISALIFSGRPNIWRFSGAVGLSTLALATHGSAMIALPALAGATLVAMPRKWGYLAAMAIGAGFYFPIALQHRGLAKVSDHVAWMPEPTIEAWLRFPALLQMGRQIVVAPVVVQVAISLLVVFLVLRAFRESDLEAHLALQWIFTWVASAVAGALSFGICHIERYFGAAIVCQAVVIGMAACSLWSSPIRWGRVGALSITATTFFSAACYFAFPPFTPWREMARLIDAQRRPMEKVQIFCSPVLATPFEYYYQGELNDGNNLSYSENVYLTPECTGIWVCFRRELPNEEKLLPDWIRRRFPNEKTIEYANGSIVHLWQEDGDVGTSVP